MKKYIRTTEDIFTTDKDRFYSIYNEILYSSRNCFGAEIIAQSDDIYELIQEGDLIAHKYYDRIKIENVIEVGVENDNQLAIIRTETATFWRYKGGEINLKNIVAIYVPSEEGYRKVWER